MSFRLVIKPESEADAEEAAKWYNNQKENLGLNFSKSWIKC